MAKLEVVHQPPATDSFQSRSTRKEGWLHRSHWRPSQRRPLRPFPSLRPPRRQRRSLLPPTPQLSPSFNRFTSPLRLATSQLWPHCCHLRLRRQIMMNPNSKASLVLKRYAHERTTRRTNWTRREYRHYIGQLSIIRCWRVRCCWTAVRKLTALEGIYKLRRCTGLLG